MSGGNHRTNNRQGVPGPSLRQQHNADKKRSANAVALTDFSQKKGQVRALEEFKKRKNRKQLDTSMALRKYRKLMKKEGMHAGTGASRKRRAENTFDDKGGESDEEVGWNDNENNERSDPDNDSKSNRKPHIPGQSDGDGSDDGSEIGKSNDSGDGDENEKEKEEEIEEPTEEKAKRKRTKPNRMDPFQKSRERGELAKQRVEEAALSRVSNEKERQKKLRWRKHQTKLLQKRTKRGQPIMKHAINNLLYKMEKQKKESEESDDRSNADDADHKQQRRNKTPDFSKYNQPRRDPPENSQQKTKKRARKFY